jgi:hypothetical protein
MTNNSIFFNHSFEKKRLKALISWIHNTFGEKEALRVVDELKGTGFKNATRAGLSIGLHDLITPPEKPFLISKAQRAMNKTDQDFKGGKITATERSQRIIDTWHRTSETLRKQVADHFNTYDQLNSVYVMALSGARGNFSQVRQLIGMRGLMADPQGQIISFPIRSNFREGLTLTEYFISCSGARKGLVDTALRTADTGYLTRRLVDVSHQVVIRQVSCDTSRGIVLKAFQTGTVGGSTKTLIPLKDRLIGRVLAEDIKIPTLYKTEFQQQKSGPANARNSNVHLKRVWDHNKTKPTEAEPRLVREAKSESRAVDLDALPLLEIGSKIERARLEDSLEKDKSSFSFKPQPQPQPNPNFDFARANSDLVDYQDLIDLTSHLKDSHKLVTRNSEISPNLAVQIAGFRDQVIVRSSLTCACTHEVCQLCYGWSLSHGQLVSLGEAVGIIAAQSIGEPGTQLTMRTFHTGGVFSGDILQGIKAPHAGKVFFPQALQGLLIRTAQGQIAFLIKIPGVLLLDDGKSQVTRIQLQAATMVFVRQGQVIESNTIVGELAGLTTEGNQPIKSRQTLFAEFGGRVTHQRGKTLKAHTAKDGGVPPSALMEVDWYTNEEQNIADDVDEEIDRVQEGFKLIEPIHSLSLGVFRILAIRVGALENHVYRTKANALLASQAQVSPQEETRVNLQCAHPFLSVYKLSSVGYTRAKLGQPLSGQSGTVRRSSSFCGPAAKTVCREVSRSLWRADLEKEKTRAKDFGRQSSAMGRPKTRLYLLNTIAEEGDLVDENYKDCTFSNSNDSNDSNSL